MAQIGAEVRPQLGPAIKRGAEEQKGFFAHLPVFEPQIRLDHGRATVPHPFLVAAGSLPGVHAFCHAGGVLRSRRRIRRQEVYLNHTSINKHNNLRCPGDGDTVEGATGKKVFTYYGAKPYWD